MGSRASSQGYWSSEQASVSLSHPRHYLQDWALGRTYLMANKENQQSGEWKNTQGRAVGQGFYTASGNSEGSNDIPGE